MEDAISKLDLRKARVGAAKLVAEVASGLEILILQKPGPRKFYVFRTSHLKLTLNRHIFETPVRPFGSESVQAPRAVKSRSYLTIRDGEGISIPVHAK
jgi:hypothetical protein